MNCAIPSDVITLVYKELHYYLTSQLINEYRNAYYFDETYCGCSSKIDEFMFNYRNYDTIDTYQADYIFNCKGTYPRHYKLPKRYLYSTVKEIDCIEIN